MKSETIKFTPITKPLPFPKLMEAKHSKTIILATSGNDEYITGTTISKCGFGIGTYSNSWNSSEFLDLPIDQVIQLSNN